MPLFEEHSASSAWAQIDFLSDLHLAPDTPATLAAFGRHLHDTPAQAVFLLGDIFEVWVGDDARFDGFEAQCTALLHLAAQRLQLFFMPGNRDFLVGSALLADVGMQGLSDPTVLTAFGQRILLSHGDALCLDDADYQRFRAEVRGQAWQTGFLSKPLEERRTIARGLRTQSEDRKRGQMPGDWSDLDAAACLDWLAHAKADLLIHGHTHRPATHALAAGKERVVLSDWDLDGQHGPARAEVLRLSAAGLQRLSLV
ncbi:MAG: UDP-2,3-diacylglucosamine diphosphatase [Burkholderiaceae bacterium]|nr:UDP-2,3-diacylglucosamine diphosphatase [Burkholderiaceae bacterium]